MRHDTPLYFCVVVALLPLCTTGTCKDVSATGSDMYSKVSADVDDFVKGSPQTRCYAYVLKGVGVSCGVVGILVLATAFAEFVGVASPVFGERLAVIWDLFGGGYLGFTATVGWSLALTGALFWVAATYRTLLNTLTLVCFLSTACFCTLFVAASLVSARQVDSDMARLWYRADVGTLCDLQQSLRCSGLMHACTSNPPAVDSVAPLPRAVVAALAAEPSAGDGCERVATCSQYYPRSQRGSGVAEDNPVPCISVIARDAGNSVMFLALVGIAVSASLTLVCLVSTQPIGKAAAFTLFLLIWMTLGFHCWRLLREPSAERVTYAQKMVAGAADVTCLALTLISVAGLHWKDQLENTVKRRITCILMMVPVFAVASAVALAFPALEDCMAVIREVYSTLLLWVLVSVWDHTADTATPVSVSTLPGGGHGSAEDLRESRRKQIKVLCCLKIIFLDLNAYFFADLYPEWAGTAFLWADILAFSVLLTIVYAIYLALPQIHATGKHQFVSIKAIVSFIFFEFTMLNVLNREGLQTVIMGEMYVSIALVGVASFQFYTWILQPIGVSTPMNRQRPRPNASYGTMERV